MDFLGALYDLSVKNLITIYVIHHLPAKLARRRSDLNSSLSCLRDQIGEESSIFDLFLLLLDLLEGLEVFNAEKVD